VRTDENLERSFRGSSRWKVDAFTGRENPELDHRVQDGGRIVEGKFLTHSFSGHERNHLFVNQDGRKFNDVSEISGLDTQGDSRGFALWDYDHDGWQDVALANANSPVLNLYRNRMGSLPTENGTPRREMFAIRFVGGNHTSSPSHELSSRDGYGAMVRVSLGDRTLIREHRCGEGFAVQNSATLIVGIGTRPRAQSLRVRWPSGKTAELTDIEAGTLVTVYENPADSPDGQPFTRQPYRATAPDAQGERPAPTAQVKLPQRTAPAATLRIYTTMATWCVACQQQYPQLEYLKALLGDQLQLYGVPVDPEDTADKLSTYLAQHKPPYELLVDLNEGDRQHLRTVMEHVLEDPPLPSTLVTDAQGRVLGGFPGVPTASDVIKLLP
jgi:hypothetical protein